jgi:hypothetical protein
MSTSGSPSSQFQSVSPLSSEPFPREKSDHVALLKWAYGRFLSGDMPALRSVMTDKIQMLVPFADSIPKPKPSDVPWVRSSSTFDDFVKTSEMMMADIDLNLEIVDFFMSTTNQSDMIVVLNCKAMGKSTAKSAVFKLLHQFSFNEQHSMTKCVQYYDTKIWKEIL